MQILRGLLLITLLFFAQLTFAKVCPNMNASNRIPDNWDLLNADAAIVDVVNMFEKAVWDPNDGTITCYYHTLHDKNKFQLHSHDHFGTPHWNNNECSLAWLLCAFHHART